jgi:hypothetical protein
MSAPIYVNKAEILTYGSKEEGDLVVIRYFYLEPKLKSIDYPKLLGRPGPNAYSTMAVIMPRRVAKDFLKKFLGFMAREDEHGRKNA